MRWGFVHSESFYLLDVESQNDKRGSSIGHLEKEVR